MKYRPRRKLTEFDVVLAWETGESTVTVLDVNSAGARVRLMNGTELAEDLAVKMLLRGRGYRATVKWSRSGEAGLVFALPLPPDVLALLARDTHYRQGIGSPRRA